MIADSEFGESPRKLSDKELISRVRRGDASAQTALYERHYSYALRVAFRHANSSYEAEDLVAEGFERTFGALQTGNGPNEFFRAYLSSVVSRLAAANNEKEKRRSLVGDFSFFDVGDDFSDPAVNAFESRVVGSAFRSLPERWQAVLWFTEVDGLKPSEVTHFLDLSANAVAALALRAREGLREAYLQAHVSEPKSTHCQIVAKQLGAYVRNNLSSRKRIKS